jgi:lysophospholipase L1-like esterase
MGRAYVAREDGPLHVLSNGKQTPMTRADAPSPPPSQARVLLVGDSHLARLGPTVPALGEEVTNVARGGAFAHDLAGQVARRGTARHDLVVLSVGTNDAAPWKQVPLPQFEHTLTDLVAGLRCPVVLVSPPGVAESRLVRAHDRTSEVVGQYAGRAARVVLAAGGRVVDTPAVIAPLGDDAYLDDGVHLGPAAYALLLPALATAVLEVLSAPPRPGVA